MDLSSSFSGLSIEPIFSSPRSRQQQQQPSGNPNPNPPKLDEVAMAPSKTANEMLVSPLSPSIFHQEQKASSDSNPNTNSTHGRPSNPNPNSTHGRSRKFRIPLMKYKFKGSLTRSSKSLSTRRSHQRQQKSTVSVPAPEEIQKAFQSARTADEMLEVFLHMASLDVVLMLLDVEGEDPEKFLSFASRAVKALDSDEKPTIHVVIALQLMGSANYSLNKFDKSLSCLNKANRILGRLEEEGLDMDCIWALPHRVHHVLARVNMAMGKMEDAFQNLRKCLEIVKMNLDEPRVVGYANYDLAAAYACVLNYVDALPFCLEALEIHMNSVGHSSGEVLQDRSLLTLIYTELLEYEKALEQNKLLQKVLKELGMNYDLLRREIDAADLNILLGNYDEALVILKRALLKSDKESETRAQILISMANALFKQEKLVDAKRCLNIAGGILDNGKMEKTAEVSEAYAKMGMLYETMKEYETAISLFKKMLVILEKHPEKGKYSAALSCARIGRMLLRSGEVLEGTLYMETAVEKMKASLGPKHVELVSVYMYLGAAYLMSRRSEPAAQMFEAMKAIPEADPDSIEACRLFSNAYDTMESSEVAIEKQQQIIAQFKRRGRVAQDELRGAERHLEQVLQRAAVASLLFAQRVYLMFN